MIHKIRKLSSSIPGMTTRDGSSLVYFNNELHLLGGWNGNLPTPLNNEHWKSSDEGNTWIQLPNAPWTPRHIFGCVVKDNAIWVFGSDYSLPARDVWKFTVTNGWELISSDWGVVGNRVLYSHCLHKNYLYVAGGQLDSTPDKDVYRSLDGITWTKIGEIPIPLETSTLVSFRNSLYLFGGGIYNSGNYNKKVFKSDDDGATWRQIAYIPDLGTYWCNGAATDNCIFYIGGINDANVNMSIVLCSEDGINWKKLKYCPILERHASGVTAKGEDFFVVTGNDHSDAYHIIRIDKY